MTTIRSWSSGRTSRHTTSWTRQAQEALRATVKTEVDGHIAAAWEAADPDPATSLKHVFAEDA